MVRTTFIEFQNTRFSSTDFANGSPHLLYTMTQTHKRSFAQPDYASLSIRGRTTAAVHQVSAKLFSSKNQFRTDIGEVFHVNFLITTLFSLDRKLRVFGGAAGSNELSTQVYNAEGIPKPRQANQLRAAHKAGIQTCKWST